MIGTPDQHTRHLAAHPHTWWQRAGDRAVDAWDHALHQYTPQLAHHAIIVAACMLLAGWWWIAPTLRKHVPTERRDPIRLFTAEQRRAGFDRAGSRCEMSTVWGTRCRRAAEHGDHWFPWSRGGATSMNNFVAACARHNMAKSDTWPGRLEQMLLTHRRRRYFPQGTPVSAGARHRRRSGGVSA